MARIVTKTGDKGTTGIFAGERVPKDCTRIEANGNLDELNAHLGLIRAMMPISSPTHSFIGQIQLQMMQMMSLVATPSDKRGDNPNEFKMEWLTTLEEEVANIMSQTPNNGSFILPGGTVLSAQMQIARTVARRAERRLWTLHREDPLPDGLVQFINRLSDYLFVLAKWEMMQQGWDEEIWQAFSYKRKKKPAPEAE